MRDVLLQIRDNQQQLQHTVALIRIRPVGAFLEILDDRERVREQPFNAARIERVALAAKLESPFVPDERFVQEMVKAELFGHQAGRNQSSASRPPAVSERISIH